MLKHRIFIAIEIPEGLKDICERHLQSFFNNKNFRIAQKESWHITISFLGYLADGEIEKLKKIVRKICSEIKPFEIVADKIIFAPSDRPKRMIWLEFGNSKEFETLKNKIEIALVSLQKQGLFQGFRKENRTSHIHLTLARFQPEHFSELKKFLPQEGIDLKKSAKSFLVDKIFIMESFLSRQGAEYKIVERIELQ